MAWAEGIDTTAPIETTTGTITYVAQDAPATIAINGQIITAVGQTIVGTSGTLTIVTKGKDAGGTDYSSTQVYDRK